MIIRQFYICLILTTIFIHNGTSQVIVEAKIVDKESSVPLINAYAINLSTEKGTISNEQGYFRLQCHRNDTLLFKYLGYEDTLIPVNKIIDHPMVFLEQTKNIIDLITIKANDEYLYELLTKCRNKLKQDKAKKEAKTFLNVVSICNQKPVEYIEAFYNSQVKQGALEALHFKNGLSTLGKHEGDGYFFNLNISRALVTYSLLSDESKFPNNPLHYAKRKLKKKYWLSREYIDDKIICISFDPKENNNKLFKGRIWINKMDNNILKIELESNHQKQNIFIGIGASTLNSIDYQISFSFLEKEQRSVLNHIKLEYEAKLTSTSARDSTTNNPILLNIKSEAIAHLFDYETIYQLPHFQFQENLDDYRLFTVPPKDKEMWTAISNSNQIKLTPDKLEIKKALDSSGRKFSIQISEEDKLFKSNFMHWDKERRVFLKKTKKPKKQPRLKYINGLIDTESNIFVDKFHIETKIYFDYIKTDTNLIYTTSSILDNYTSFNYLEDNDNIRCYTNIYFDITELYRRKLVSKIEASDKTIETVNSIFESNNSKMTAELKQFRKECYAGSNVTKLKEWNKYILENLGVNNMVMFAVFE